MHKKTDTSWNKSGKSYNKIVGQEGHYYHQHVVLPGIAKLFPTGPTARIVDLGCGQGVLARALPTYAQYLGIDAAPALIQAARKQTIKPNTKFVVADVTKPPQSQEKSFSHAACVLALQNMADPEAAIKTAAAYLEPKGVFLLVINHPSFRIPRQSGWKVDEGSRQQFRWENRYLSALKIPIQMTPGSDQSNVTWSFHRPLQDYCSMLKTAGFVITDLEEWASDKESAGKAAKMENRAREEFPLFLAIRAVKS